VIFIVLFPFPAANVRQPLLNLVREVLEVEAGRPPDAGVPREIGA
jgi:hypothetical protein